MHSTIAAAVVLLGSAAALTAGPRGPAVAADAAWAAAGAACPDVRLPTGLADSVYLETQVDEPARPRRNNPQLGWPRGFDERLGPSYQSRVRDLTMGEVELRFVVDRDGCADMRTVRVVSTTDSAFTTVVVEALPRWRFEPAVKDGERVAQLLQWKWVLHKRTGARVPGTN